MGVGVGASVPGPWAWPRSEHGTYTPPRARHSGSTGELHVVRERTARSHGPSHSSPRGSAIPWHSKHRPCCQRTERGGGLDLFLDGAPRLPACSRPRLHPRAPFQRRPPRPNPQLGSRNGGHQSQHEESRGAAGWFHLVIITGKSGDKAKPDPKPRERAILSPPRARTGSQW